MNEMAYKLTDALRDIRLARLALKNEKVSNVLDAFLSSAHRKIAEVIDTIPVEDCDE